MEGEYFDNLGDKYFGSLEGKHFDNRLAYNKAGVDSVKVENDLGTMIIISDSFSPHKKKLTCLLFSFLTSLMIWAKQKQGQSFRFSNHPR